MDGTTALLPVPFESAQPSRVLRPALALLRAKAGDLHTGDTLVKWSYCCAFVEYACHLSALHGG